jgi:hypothetical protein
MPVHYSNISKSSPQFRNRRLTSYKCSSHDGSTYIVYNVQNPEKVNFLFQKPGTSLVSCSCHLPNTQQPIIFSHWLYILGWDLTSSMSFCHFSLDCALIPQFLHPTRTMSSSNSSHHLNFCLPLLLSPFPPSLVPRTFFADHFLNTFQVPTNKSFGWVIIRLPSRFPCICPINCLALLLLRFRYSDVFLWSVVVSPTSNPPTWRTRISFVVWVITFDLSRIGPTSS